MEKTVTEKKKKSDLFSRREMDIPFLILVLVLLTIGLIMLFSASYTYASYNKGSSTYYFARQLLFAVVGIIGMLVISRINYKYFSYVAVFGFGFSILLLLYVFIQPQVLPGFYRWILIPGVGLTFQPSEVAKMMLIMLCAWSMDRYNKYIVGNGDSIIVNRLSKGKMRFPSRWMALFVYLGIIGAVAGLVFFENHLSGAVLIAAIGIVMIWLGECPTKFFIFSVIIGVILLVYVVLNPDILKEYMGERIVAWLDKDYSPMGTRWQINQSLFAIGSGGFLGSGLGNSLQKHLYVSEPQNDFIFAIVCEELGFVGATLIMILYALLVWRGVLIGINAKTKFGSLLAMGMVFQVGLQVVLNIAVVTDTIPNTGIGLPFFSAGGTSLCILLAEMGVVLSVSRYSKVSSFRRGLSKKKTASQEPAKAESGAK